MSSTQANAKHKISTLNEGPLHAALKEWYAEPDDRFEVPVDGYLVDVVRGDLLVEIQTSNFAALRSKLRALIRNHRVRLVYPIAQRKWIVRLADDGAAQLGRRRSPKLGSIDQLFGELLRIPDLLADPNFSLEVLFIHEEEVRQHDPARGWRKHHWVTRERRLIDVVGQRLFKTPADVAATIPGGTPEPFTTAELARALERPRWLAQQMAYCLRKMGAIEQVGWRRKSILYVRAAA